MIHLTRSIEQAWRRSVEQTEELQSTLCETGRLSATISLNQEMGEQALVMLEKVLSGTFEQVAAWDRDESGNFVRTIDNVLIRYHPDSHNLQIEAQLIQNISSTARATQELCGFTIGDVAAEAVKQYFDDGWGGRTKEKAEKEALVAANQRLDEAIEQLHRDQNELAFQTAENQAKQKAHQLAQETLSQRAAETRKTMQDQLTLMLHHAMDTARYEMNIAIGEAYRQTFIMLALNNNGKIISNVNTGRVIQMELEF